MRVLVACECSGVVRRAFRARGHDAWSCDILPSEDDSRFHIRGDALVALHYGGPWDLVIAHPPCQFLAVSGARWMSDPGRKQQQERALDFVRAFMYAPVARVCIENPVSVISSRIRKPDQIVQPWQFGHGEVKATCLWLKGLPKLKPTRVVEGREARVWRLPPSVDRARERSRTFVGIGEAMAEQWGCLEVASCAIG